MPLVLAVIILLMLVDLVLTARLIRHVEVLGDSTEPARALPCAAIPTRFILDEPACADKLLRSMNTTNVRILARPVFVPNGSIP